MTDYRLAVINGTGPPGSAYDQIMQTSFCYQLGQKLGARSFYIRGPSLLGQELRTEAKAAYRWLRSVHDTDPNVRLMIAGYSRGGSAAIMTCEMLERDGVAVDSLFLFDAVARHEFRGGAVIPGNVRFSRHARRSLAEEFVEKYEGTLKKFNLIGGQNPIRPLFGNTGLTWRGEGDHRPAEAFMGSHGALGGVGWRFVIEDSDCEQAVARWMNRHLEGRGLDITLEAFAPATDAPVTHPSHLEKWLAHNLYQFALHEHEANLFGHDALSQEKVR